MPNPLPATVPSRANLPAFCCRVAVASLVVLLVLPQGAFAQASAGGAMAARINSILRQVEDRGDAEYWATVSKLIALGEEVLPAVRQQIGHAGPDGVGDRGRLACAAILLEEGEVEDTDRAVLVLERLLEKTRDKWVTVAAIRLLGLHGDPDEVQPQLEERLSKTRDPEILIPLAEVLWEMDHVDDARKMLVKLVDAKDIQVKREAALALAGMGYFEGEVRDVLRELKDEPSEQGRRAADLDRVMQLSRQLDRKLDEGDVILEGVDPAKLLKIKDEKIRKLQEEVDALREGDLGTAREGDASARVDRFTLLLEEVVEKTQKYYVDAGKIDREQLFLAAIRGMVASLDRFSSFMDVSDTKRFHEAMAGEYFGIGAHVQKAENQPGPLEIRKILYGGPAHEAGILSSDRVVAIDGKSILALTLDEVIAQLKGPANTKITLTVDRPGESSTKDFVLVRGRVEVPSVYSDLLPGRIGYVRLDKFGDRSAEDVIRALDDLEKRGMQGLILDLRDNPGGRRDAAVRIVDEFVAGELPILTQKGRTGDEISTLPDPDRRPNYPMAVLVNDRSASASEIVAGALQDYGRVTVIGERTFGKGSVQRVIQMSPQAEATLGGEARLRLTVQYYFLPLGKCIHTIRDKDGHVIERGGIDPDIEVRAERIHEWELLARNQIQRDDEVLNYVARHFDELKRLHNQVDGRDPKKYPEFDALYGKWKGTASENDLRSVLRLLTRRRLEDQKGEDFACDYLEDRQLQRAILKILEDLDSDPKSLPPYDRFEEWLAADARDVASPVAGSVSDSEPEPESESDG